MDMRTAFPTPWFTASDFDGIGQQFTIGNVMNQQVGADFKPVMYFNGQEKGLVLNPSNNKILIALLGWDSKSWTGQQIVVFSFTAMFQGQPQLRLGVRAPDGRATQAAPAPVPSRQPPLPEYNDDVPF